MDLLYLHSLTQIQLRNWLVHHPQLLFLHLSKHNPPHHPLFQHFFLSFHLSYLSPPLVRQHSFLYFYTGDHIDFLKLEADFLDQKLKEVVLFLESVSELHGFLLVFYSVFFLFRKGFVSCDFIAYLNSSLINCIQRVTIVYLKRI